MSLHSKRPNRLVIPRWRDFKETSNTGELAKEKGKNTLKLPSVSIQNQINNWKKERSVINAIELVNSAYLINDKTSATSAAQYIIQSCTDANHPSLIIANLILNGKNDEEKIETTATASFSNLHLKIQCKIQEIRRRLNNYSYNAILWIDMARWYTVIGKISDAEKCIKTAIQLAPNNVFVIRSAVRFFLHKSKYDRAGEDSLSFALQLIRKNPATKVDPWMMATEISLCALVNKTSSLMKTGITMVGDRNFSPFALSELTAALATEELKHSGSKSKKLFSNALIDPNENTIAQAQWATKIVGNLPFDFNKRNSFEASSYLNANIGDWVQSFDEALNWVVDEPFSCQPVNHASYLAGSIIDNNEFAIQICNFGLRANPKEFTLLNNKAYSLAVEGKSLEAENVFNQIEMGSLKEHERISYSATKGLIQYCKGNSEVGNLLYNEAEALAVKNKDHKTAFRVKIFKTRAEYIFNPEQVDKVKAIENLTNELDKFNQPDIVKTLDNLKKRLGVELNITNTDTKTVQFITPK
jgi:tetratricopeptide (TPR) repeat protein